MSAGTIPAGVTLGQDRFGRLVVSRNGTPIGRIVRAGAGCWDACWIATWPDGQTFGTRRAAIMYLVAGR